MNISLWVPRVFALTAVVGILIAGSVIPGRAQPDAGRLAMGKAMTFDVFGTVVDWRSSIIKEGQELSGRLGFEVDWAQFADDWRGGYGPAMRRVAERGQGWYAYDISPEGLAAKLPRLDEKLAQAGRSRDDLMLYVGPNRHPITSQTSAAYAELGVEQIVAPLGARTVEKLALRADALIESVRG